MTQLREQRSEVRDQTSEEAPRAGYRFDRSTINNQPSPVPSVALLTGGSDKPYALPLVTALTSEEIRVDLIGSDELYIPELFNNDRVTFLNLRGDQRENVSLLRKVARILRYYGRLVRYAAGARPRIFHILWNNKFELIDRVFLMLYYRLLGKKVVFTAHNVNVGKRDLMDTRLNRLTLKIQYRLADYIFVHTKAMKDELAADFGISDDKIGVIPFGINNTVPNTALTAAEAKRQLGITRNEKTMLFFGNIAPYKGLDYLIAALAELTESSGDYRLIIAGRPKKLVTPGRLMITCDQYWNDVQEAIARRGLDDRVIKKIEFIPDEQTELYFKAADVLILPYTNIFQSGVLFLGYGFGLPAIAANVGSLKEEIIEGKTGFMFKPQDSRDLAEVIERYFGSELFRNLERRRWEIKEYANEQYSWEKVAAITTNVYSNLLKS